MPELLDQLLDNEQQAQADARDAYRRLLARRDNPEPGDADLLRRTLAALGITSADFKADAAAVATVTRLEAAILSPAELKSTNEARTAACKTAEAELRQLARDMVDSVDPMALPHVIGFLMPRAGAAPKGTLPFHQQETSITQRWVDAQNTHMSRVGLHEQNSKQAAALRAKHPRAFAD
jgi:hypothetical protein